MPPIPSAKNASLHIQDHQRKPDPTISPKLVGVFGEGPGVGCGVKAGKKLKTDGWYFSIPVSTNTRFENPWIYKILVLLMGVDFAKRWHPRV
jgi:hypothetical protein